MSLKDIALDGPLFWLEDDWGRSISFASLARDEWIQVFPQVNDTIIELYVPESNNGLMAVVKFADPEMWVLLYQISKTGDWILSEEYLTLLIGAVVSDNPDDDDTEESWKEG